MRGMQRRSRRAVLPSLHIGSTENEITGTNVIPDPHRRKRNQRVMNHRQSTSISGKHEPENLVGEGRGEGCLEKAPAAQPLTRPPSLRYAQLWQPPSPTRGEGAHRVRREFIGSNT